MNEINADDVQKFADIIYEPGEFFEVRVLYPKGTTGKPHAIFSGWWTRENVPLLCRKLSMHAKHAEGIYATVQRQRQDKKRLDVLPKNQLVPVSKRLKLTCDADIDLMRYLLVDVDPVRPAGTSATDEEKQQANEVFTGICELFGSCHAVCSALVDSGNGFHGYFPWGANENYEMSKTLSLLDRARSTAFAKIDTTVWNPSRIMKLPGTWARKGESTDARPHRQAKILYPM